MMSTPTVMVRLSLFMCVRDLICLSMTCKRIRKTICNCIDIHKITWQRVISEMGWTPNKNASSEYAISGSLLLKVLLGKEEWHCKDVDIYVAKDITLLSSVDTGYLFDDINDTYPSNFRRVITYGDMDFVQMFTTYIDKLSKKIDWIIVDDIARIVKSFDIPACSSYITPTKLVIQYPSYIIDRTQVMLYNIKCPNHTEIIHEVERTLSIALYRIVKYRKRGFRLEVICTQDTIVYAMDRMGALAEDALRDCWILL